METNHKLTRLKSILEEMQNVVIAYSVRVDGVFLLDAITDRTWMI